MTHQYIKLNTGAKGIQQVNPGGPDNGRQAAWHIVSIMRMRRLTRAFAAGKSNKYKTLVCCPNSPLTSEKCIWCGKLI